jgi:hypothetical protein
MRCGEARDLLQRRHDEWAAPGAGDSPLDRHLEDCAACERFARFLGGLGGEVRAALDEVAARMPAPDYPAVFAAAAGTADARERARFAPRRLHLALAAAAAVLVVSVGFAGRAWIGQRGRALVAAQVSAFVDELFAEPLLAAVEAPEAAAGSGLRAWLEGTDAPFLP